jgi:ketosteroid isomerase-like protein
MAFCALLTIVSATAVAHKGPDAKGTIVRFYELRERTLDQRGTKQDVEQLLALFAPGASYEHPGAGVVMNIEQARSGLLAHLGEGSNADFHFNQARVDENYAVVEVTLRYTVEGKLVNRRGVAVFEFKKGKIARLAEY